MKIKVYHQNGEVKITKIMSRKELVLFSNLEDGEMAEIDIDVSQCTNAKKKRADNSSVDRCAIYPENLTLPDVIKGHPFEHAIKTLQLARDTLYLKTDEAARAIAVLMDKWDEYQVLKDIRSDLKELSPEDLFVNAIRILELESQAGIYLSSEEANQAIQKLKDVIKERMNKKYGKGIV